ncbi:triadin-like [Nematolebias whitei]|uniref:triadin-like n=1 Tax=Nematolebias whitei TaxID=451745 RepID=UPI00189A8065|nr:triadin-like [Nematolebias whitei]
MTGQSSSVEVAPPSRSNQRTFVDDVILTFTSPMAWLLIVALIITWSAVAVVLFDLLDYKTLTDYTSYCDDPVCLSPGLPPPSAFGKRGFKARVGVRAVKSGPAVIETQESSDWLEMVWTFVASLVAPDQEEEGIHHLTETLTSFHSEEL